MIQLSKDKWRLETELRCHKPASKAIIESSNQWLYVGGALGLMFVYWSKCLLDAGFAGLCKLRQRKQRPKSSTFPYHQLIFCACVLYGFLIVTHTNTHWKKPNTSYKCRIAAVFSESQHVLNIHVQHTVYCIPTSRDTCNHKRIQTLPKTSHRFGTWRRLVILSLIAQKLTHLSLGSLEKMVHVEHRV